MRPTRDERESGQDSGAERGSPKGRSPLRGEGEGEGNPKGGPFPSLASRRQRGRTKRRRRPATFGTSNAIPGRDLFSSYGGLARGGRGAKAPSPGRKARGRPWLSLANRLRAERSWSRGPAGGETLRAAPKGAAWGGASPVGKSPGAGDDRRAPKAPRPSPRGSPKPRMAPTPQSGAVPRGRRARSLKTKGSRPGENPGRMPKGRPPPGGRPARPAPGSYQ